MHCVTRWRMVFRAVPNMVWSRKTTVPLKLVILILPIIVWAWLKWTNQHQLLSQHANNLHYDSITESQLFTEFNATTDIEFSGLEDQLTIVTAYFNIGSFAKGAANAVKFTPELYRQWMAAFALIENPLVVFVDNKDDLDYFRLVRSRLPASRTRFVLVNRTSLWSFSVQTESRIAAIFGQPNYPHHFPNTVVPRYVMSMFAKFEAVQAVARSNPFSTRYISWLDIGLFRDYTDGQLPSTNTTNNKSPFVHLRSPPSAPMRLYLPPNFTLPDVENSSIAVCEVFKRNTALTPQKIVAGNHVWIGGGFFAGRVDVVFRWTVEFLQGVQWLLQQGLCSTDQQVIYSMFNAADQGEVPTPRTRLAKYRDDGRYNRWFHLAYISRDEGAARMNRSGQLVQPTTVLLCVVVVVVVSVAWPRAHR